jgi:predicted PurR-regulated permease PerM
MNISFEFAIAFVAILLLAFIAIAVFLAFAVGKILQRQTELTKQGHISLCASFYALSEARSFKYSTIIQRIVETKPDKPNWTPEQVEAQVKAANVEFEDFLDGTERNAAELKRIRERGAQMSATPRWTKGDDVDETYDPSADDLMDDARELT